MIILEKKEPSVHLHDQAKNIKLFRSANLSRNVSVRFRESKTASNPNIGWPFCL